VRALIASIVGVTALAVAATLVTLVRLLRAARSPSPQRGDVILVFGAAVSANGPSPALRARVEHAARLYREARAPLVLCGGTALETGAMRTLLRQGGVLERAILSEQAISTRETVGAAIRRGNGGWHRVLAVSSRYHMHRVLAEARRQGLPAVGCPAPRAASGAPASSPRARLLLALLRRHAYEVAATWWYAISARQARP
jgi:uncharacterized SAM-binding protein YcdF (DUF218 family)